MNIREFQETKPNEEQVKQFFGQHTTCGCERYKGICDTPWCAYYSSKTALPDISEALRGLKSLVNADLFGADSQGRPADYRVRWWDVLGSRYESKAFFDEEDAEQFAELLVTHGAAKRAEVIDIVKRFGEEPTA